jgi:hypothetical protein
MVLIAQFSNFGKFVKLIFTLIPKHHLILIICPTTTKSLDVSKHLFQRLQDSYTISDVVYLENIQKLFNA